MISTSRKREEEEERLPVEPDDTSSVVTLESAEITADQGSDQPGPSEEVSTESELTRFETRFIVTLLVVCNFGIANGVSLQGPFFPKEAESKGATPLVYSSIFAIYELVMLVTSFLFGNFVDRFKPNLMSGIGLTVTGISTALFGLLTYQRSVWFFTVNAFVLRIVESLGATAFATSSYSFISTCFPDRTGTMFATMETFFGLGVITGPVLGGFLYGLGGFLFPFLVMGVAMTLCGALVVSHPIEKLFHRGKLIGQRKSLVESNNNTDYKNLNGEESSQLVNESGPEEMPKVTLGRFLSSSVIVLDSVIIITAITLMGFNGATLEPFIRHEGITQSTLYTSLMFVALGASYAFSAMLWGKICDRYPSKLLLFAIYGSVATALGLVFIGPIPMLSDVVHPSLGSIAACLVLFGIGTSAKQVSAYTHSLNYTIHRRKFPANQQTYGYISGLFFSCLSFGGFVGPIIGGGLLQWFNFPLATVVMLAIELIVFVLLLVLQFCCSQFRISS